MNDKPKKSWRDWLGWAVFGIGLCVSVVLYTIGYGLLAYVILLAAIAPLLWQVVATRWWNRSEFTNLEAIGLGIAFLSWLISGYFLATKNPTLDFTFTMIGTIALLAVYGNKARQTPGKVRFYYIGYMAFFVAYALLSLRRTLPTDGYDLQTLVAQLSLLLFGIAAIMMLPNQQIAKQYWQEQRQQKQLEPGSLDAIHDEQPKPHMVKEQR